MNDIKNKLSQNYVFRNGTPVETKPFNNYSDFRNLQLIERKEMFNQMMNRKSNLVDSKVTARALFYLNNTKMSSVEYDNISKLVYIATDDGKILKLSLNNKIKHDEEFFHEPLVTQELQVLDNQEIIHMKIEGNNRDSMLVVGRQDVVTVSLNQCDVYKTCEQCLFSQDASCSWNMASNKCEWGANG